MRILITNDDGIQSAVLPDFIRWAETLGEVTVVAPKFEQSGKSQAIDFRRHSEVKKVDLGVDCDVYYMDSTPADCVRFAVLGLNKQYDIVFSGINRGYNLGEDISYSGTVGAIFEAERLGMKGIAFSTDVTTFDYALKHLEYVHSFIIDNELLSYSNLINVNFPTMNAKGICITKQGTMFYSDEFVHLGDGMYMQRGEPIQYVGDDTTVDIHAVANGYISVTPVTSEKTNFTAYEAIKNIKKGV